MRMGENAAAFHTVLNAIQALGRGFDVNFDTRLLYCKGVAGSRIVEVDEEHTKDLLVCDEMIVPDVSRDIRCGQESSGRESTGVCSFYELHVYSSLGGIEAATLMKGNWHFSGAFDKQCYKMVEYFNRKAHLSGSVPLGNFNSVFSFTGSKQIDAAATKSLAMDGFFIPLFKVQLMKSPLVLKEDVRRAVPISWEPSSLSSFIENFGTHIIASVTIGGKDVIYVKQHHLSPLSTMEIKNYVQDIGDQRFSDMESHTSSGPMKFKDKDVTVIFRRRGGDDLIQSHMMWATTVRSAPDVIEMAFVPITSLLDGIPGKDHLIRAIDLYLEYKPPIEELRYFLEFQIPRTWAPAQDNIPGHQRKEPVCPWLQFSIMGQKLYVSQEQVSVGRKPVTGLRLCLEGTKQNRLCIHLQHLASLPKILLPYWDTHVAIGAPKWQGPEEQDSRWFEPVKWKNFSHVSTAPIEYNETFIGDLSGVYIVTGAQLGVWDFGTRNVLYMRLLYSKVPGCTIRRSLWDHSPMGPSDKSKRPAIGNSSNPGDMSSSSKDVVGKLAKLIDTSEMSKGPQDSPGHWLVTGGKLGVEKGKIVLRVKYSLLNY